MTLEKIRNCAFIIIEKMARKLYLGSLSSIFISGRSANAGIQLPPPLFHNVGLCMALPSTNPAFLFYNTISDCVFVWFKPEAWGVWQFQITVINLG